MKSPVGLEVCDSGSLRSPLGKACAEKWLESADEAGYTEYGEYDKVYQNAAATLEEVEAASAGLKRQCSTLSSRGLRKNIRLM